MEPYNHHILLIISLSSLILLHSAETTCVPRNFTYAGYSSSSISLPPDSTAPRPESSIPPPVSSPWSQPEPPHLPISPPPSKLEPSSPPPTPLPPSQPPLSSPATPPDSTSSWPALSPSESFLSPPSPPPLIQPVLSPEAPPPLLFSTPDSSDPIFPAIRLPFSLKLPPSFTSNSFLKNICDKTDYPPLCLSSITPFLTGKVDPVSVFKMSIKVCSQTSQIALSVATKIAQNPLTRPRTASSIVACKDNYSDAMDNLQAALDALLSHDIGTINSMLSAAMTDFGTCEEGFLELPGVNSPMVAYDDILSKLASNCLAMVSLIK